MQEGADLFFAALQLLSLHQPNQPSPSSSLIRRKMPTAFSRAHTFPDPPPSWTDSGLSSYRDYNPQFEAYLSQAYHPQAKPYHQGPAHVYTKYTSSYALQVQADAAHLVRGRVLQGLPIFEPFLPVIMTRWNEMKVRKREDLCLQVPWTCSFSSLSGSSSAFRISSSA